MKRGSGFGRKLDMQRPSAVLLVLVNLGMVYGVLALGWTVFEIIFLYWCENLVIGAINVLRMIIASPGFPQLDSTGLLKVELEPQYSRWLDALKSSMAGLVMKLFLIPFFIVHYGGFCLGHGIFVFAMFSDQTVGEADLMPTIQALLRGPLGVSLALLAASHMFSFLFNYIGKKEYRRIGVAALMFLPYGRIVVLHITILLGGFLSMFMGNPVPALVVLVVLKTLVDLGLHNREHHKLDIS